MSTQCCISYTDRLGICDISPAWAFVLLILERAAKAKIPGKLMQRLRFFMNLSGNKDLLDRELVAFFASRNSPPQALDLARRWAYEIAHTDKIVISGFHSPIERVVLDILLAEGCSVVVALGRSLYRRIPLHLQAAYDSNRLLFVSFRNYARHSFPSSQLRNWAAAKLASEIIFAPFDSASQLSTLHFTLCHDVARCSVLR